MHCTSGRVVLNKAGHRVAYCAQNPWLEHATIRDNIVFSYEYDEAFYNLVLDCKRRFPLDKKHALILRCQPVLFDQISLSCQTVI